MGLSNGLTEVSCCYRFVQPITVGPAIWSFVIPDVERTVFPGNDDSLVVISALTFRRRQRRHPIDARAAGGHCDGGGGRVTGSFLSRPRPKEWRVEAPKTSTATARSLPLALKNNNKPSTPCKRPVLVVVGTLLPRQEADGSFSFQ
jgi:hypothetical protein